MPNAPPTFRPRRGGLTSTSTQRSKPYKGVWPRQRRMQLDREPLCRMCREPANQVDHIVPLNAGGSKDDDNLQSLCHSCHSRKTMRESRFT